MFIGVLLFVGCPFSSRSLQRMGIFTVCQVLEWLDILTKLHVTANMVENSTTIFQKSTGQGFLRGGGKGGWVLLD